ncbi:phosphatase PAP2 family protein [Cellulomonas bogoriensis]|uniref:PA-phosphatase n=1 Tax=Cellulomonas bogoriensis 69B4 = DSM 16987 TaxID=1386082 RepID=A0A0A0BNZ4_9CELL|nr:phosphatase PAP2 family protein [Cellulomonas bogoriensis]KGM09407.1 PA-phosphatase [Cellulomonas bogoriensis 69B4 = DSM 16987]
MPTADDAPRPVPTHTAVGSVRSGRRAPALVIALLASVGVWVTFWVFVTTRTGQLVEQAAFDGARYGRGELWQLAEPVLRVISVPFIALVLIAAMTLAALRRRPLLALQVAILMGGSNLTTQVLKHGLLTRPDLSVGDRLSNALPSGHTTAAASVAAALLFVVPRRLRPAAAVLGAIYTAATGISTLVGRWHRPSDAVAAVLVVVAWAALASALGAGRGPVATREPAGETVAVASLLGVGGVFAGIGAALAMRQTVADLPQGLESRGELLTAYGGGALGIASVVCLAFCVLLVMRHTAEPRAVDRRGLT